MGQSLEGGREEPEEEVGVKELVDGHETGMADQVRGLGEDDARRFLGLLNIYSRHLQRKSAKYDEGWREMLPGPPKYKFKREAQNMIKDEVRLFLGLLKLNSRQF